MEELDLLRTKAPCLCLPNCHGEVVYVIITLTDLPWQYQVESLTLLHLIPHPTPSFKRAT